MKRVQNLSITGVLMSSGGKDHKWKCSPGVDVFMYFM